MNKLVTKGKRNKNQTVIENNLVSGNFRVMRKSKAMQIFRMYGFPFSVTDNE